MAQCQVGAPRCNGQAAGQPATSCCAVRRARRGQRWRDSSTTHHSESSAANTLVHEVQWTLPYGSVIVGDCCHPILSITEKPSQQHLVLTGIYVLDDRVLSVILAEQRYDMPRLLLDAVAAGHSVRAVRPTDGWFDVGTPDTLRQAEQVVDREWTRRP